MGVLPTGMIAANCYILTCPRSHETMIVDPGADADRILAVVARQRGHVTSIVHTHGHFDHISATEAILGRLPAPVPVLAHPADSYLYEQLARRAGQQYGYAVPEDLKLPDGELQDGGHIDVGDFSLHVIATPGHTPGSICLAFGDRFVLSGDTLFKRGIGRTDLSGGDEEAIYESILTRLYTLPPTMVVWPGHGERTTIADERRSNPFVQAE